MGVDTQWRDDIEIPSGQPADLETITNIVNNLYALKEEQPLFEGNFKSPLKGHFNTNANTLLQIEAGCKWQGNVYLNNLGHSGKYYVKFQRPFAWTPVIIMQSLTFNAPNRGSVNLHKWSGTGFEFTHSGYSSRIRRGVYFIAIGVRGS